MRLATLALAATISPLIACGGGGDGGTPPGPAPVASVSLSRTSAALRISESATITATAKDANNNTLTGRSVQWAISPSGIAAISPNGASVVVTGSAVGTATLTATIEQKTAQATVTVTNTPFPSSASVEVSNNAFTPNSVDIAVGGTVTWTWAAGSVLHNVTFSGGAGAPSNIGDMSTGTASRTFSTAGSFPYSCTHHAGMNGTVVVH